MHTFLYLLVFNMSLFSVAPETISVNVVFENLTDKTEISGTFYISETNQQVVVNSLEAFSVDLPKKGKYEFRFDTDDALALTSYPTRITTTKNKVTIRLENKKETTIHRFEIKSVVLKDISNLSDAEIEEGITHGTLNFIIHGLVAPDAEKADHFTDLFGIGFISENCVVDPISFKTATNINKKIASFLTAKYGDSWKEQLPMTPFGL